MQNIYRFFGLVGLLVMFSFPWLASAQTETPTPLPSLTPTYAPTNTLIPTVELFITTATPTPSPTTSAVPYVDRGILEAGAIASGLIDGQPVAYTINGEAGESIYVLLTGSYYDTLLQVFAPSGQTVASTNFSPTGSGLELIVPELPTTGRYTIVVSTYVSGATYTLTWHPITIQPIEYRQTVEGHFTATTHAAVYSFRGRVDEWITYNFLSENVIAVITLYPLHALDRGLSAGGYSGSLNQQTGTIQLPSTSDYLLVVRGMDVGVAGDYRLRIAPVEYLPLAYGETVDGNLSFDQPTLQYQFEGEIGDVINISVESDGTLDTILALNAPDGSPLYFDDDSADFYDPEINGFPLQQSGLFTIVVQPYITGEAGHIQLTLNKRDVPSLDNGSQTVRLTSKQTVAVVQFAASAGEKVRLVVSTDQQMMNSITIRVIQNGQILASPVVQQVLTFAVEFTVPADGHAVVQVAGATYNNMEVTLSLERLSE